LGTKKSLLRVDAVPDKIDVPGKSVQLPSITHWLDADLLPARTQFDMPPLGKVTLYRTTREIARAKNGSPAKITDIGLATLIPLNKVINQPHQTKSAVFRITVKGDDKPATALAQDGRQEIKNAKGDTFELHV